MAKSETDWNKIFWPDQVPDGAFDDGSEETGNIHYINIEDCQTASTFNYRWDRLATTAVAADTILADGGTATEWTPNETFRNYALDHVYPWPMADWQPNETVCDWPPFNNVLNDLDKVWELVRVTRWVSFEDRMPDNNVRVLCCTENGEVFFNKRQNGEWLLNFDSVTHWMQSPEPPPRS